TVGAGVHHDDAVAGAEEKFGLADYANAVVGDAVEEKNPTAVGTLGLDFPAAKEDSVRRPDVEIFAVPASVGKRGVRFADEVLGKLSPDWVKESRGDKPTRNASQ
ncbi:MAG TPA: hypothetical protein VIX91_22095, partial [Candidatus Acidoferrum sp.]